MQGRIAYRAVQSCLEQLAQDLAFATIPVLIALDLLGEMPRVDEVQRACQLPIRLHSHLYLLTCVSSWLNMLLSVRFEQMICCSMARKSIVRLFHHARLGSCPAFVIVWPQTRSAIIPSQIERERERVQKVHLSRSLTILLIEQLIHLI